jgi:pimeloyl-ACP methyl ester carboxylesterase
MVRSMAGAVEERELVLIGAQRRPELIERLVVINSVPLLPGYRWHWIAQLWRRRPSCLR